MLRSVLSHSARKTSFPAVGHVTMTRASRKNRISLPKILKTHLDFISVYSFCRHKDFSPAWHFPLFSFPTSLISSYFTNRALRNTCLLPSSTHSPPPVGVWYRETKGLKISVGRESKRTPRTNAAAFTAAAADMDSMRSLNTSLPSSTPRPQPPEQLLQQFKTAALSVTNLYKNAVDAESHARQAGYQEAIEDLLHFLDRENLGLTDGEGWRVRQWATERSDGLAHPNSDDDDTERTRSATPAAPRRGPADSEDSRQESKSTSPHREDQAAAQQPPSTAATHSSDAATFDRPPVFTFSAGPTFPQVHEQDMDVQNSDSSSLSTQNESPAAVSVLARNSRQQNRHGNPTRPNQRNTARDSPVAIGSKRKNQFPDFFDLSGMGHNRDLFGGGKRGRFT